MLHSTMLHVALSTSLLSDAAAQPNITAKQVLIVCCVFVGVITLMTTLTVVWSRRQKKRRALLIARLMPLGLTAELPPTLATRAIVRQNLQDLGNNWGLLDISFGLLTVRPGRNPSSASDIHFYAAGVRHGKMLEYIEVLPGPHHRGGGRPPHYTALLIHDDAGSDQKPVHSDSRFWRQEQVVTSLKLASGELVDIMLCGQGSIRYLVCGAWLESADVEGFLAAVDQ